MPSSRLTLLTARRVSGVILLGAALATRAHAQEHAPAAKHDATPTASGAHLPKPTVMPPKPRVAPSAPQAHAAPAQATPHAAPPAQTLVLTPAQTKAPSGKSPSEKTAEHADSTPASAAVADEHAKAEPAAPAPGPAPALTRRGAKDKAAKTVATAAAITAALSAHHEHSSPLHQQPAALSSPRAVITVHPRSRRAVVRSASKPPASPRVDVPWPSRTTELEWPKPPERVQVAWPSTQPAPVALRWVTEDAKGELSKDNAALSR